MKNCTHRVAILTNILTTYRQGFYDRLFSREDIFVTVYCQKIIPGMNLHSIHERYPDNVRIVNFISVKEEKIVWQYIPWREIINNNDVIFINGNPRVLSDFLFANYLRLTGGKIVLWSQAHSYGANIITEKIRLFWTKFFKYIFVYTDSDTISLKEKGFKKNYILGMNNGLDQKIIDTISSKWSDIQLKKWRDTKSLDNMVMILSCARLVSKNKFEQIIQALPLMMTKIPNLLWCIIGDGDEKKNLEVKVNTAGLQDHVRFIGSIYDENELAPWFLSSDLLVHPASIGLTLLHSFGYGLPVVINGEAKLHGPEYAAFEPERTGRNFITGNIQSLADTVVSLLSDRDALVKMKSYTLRIAREKYNVDIMVERFVQIAQTAINA